ncbi:MAG: esterase-like activity of phytase family protein [Pseudolabrys sp.]|nr:esterase-like activity of phytase family protein [Pseudolabrys sp.]MBV9954963.1 esterase-like activity of phytase family protein [Pseudolabrys sp.]
MAIDRRTLLGLAIAGLAPQAFRIGPAAAQAPFDPPRKIPLSATPIEAFSLQDPALRRFGELEYRGGLVLRSPNRHFGGYSGLNIAADGATFIAVSDQGTWLSGRILYRDAVPIGIADAEVALALDAQGRPVKERKWYDLEALAADGDTLYVAIERVNQILKFDYGKDGLSARGQPIAVPAAFKDLPYNKGIEGLAFAPPGHPLAGALIAISERGLDKAGNIRGFLIGGSQPGQFTIRRDDEFDISDCALLPRGDLLILERRYSPARGLAIRLRRIAQMQIRPEAVLDGRTLFEADLGFQIDNMEGLAVHRGASGETILTMISDDNFSFLQRTLLLQFVLAGE